MPPLGILSLGAYLRIHGYEVIYLDLFANRMSRTAFEKFLTDKKFDFVGISAYTESFPIIKQVARIIKNQLPKTLISMGGPHVSFLPLETLQETVADFVICGEGEMTFVELLEALNYGTMELTKIKGLAYRYKDVIRINGERSYIEWMDCLPLPSISQEELDRYHIKQLIITSRGCPGKCVYCASAALSGRRYRARSAEHVFSEIAYKYYKKGERYFAFLDDTFTANRKRLYQFCDYIKKSRMDITWRCDSRTDILSREMIDRIKDCGCVAVHVGVESGSQAVIDSINKHINLKKTEALVEYINEIGMQVMASFIIGHHSDTKETIEETIQMMDRFKNKYNATIGVGINTPFPGTPLYDNHDSMGVEIENVSWSSFDLIQSVISTRNLSREEIQNAYFEILERLDL